MNFLYKYIRIYSNIRLPLKAIAFQYTWKQKGAAFNCLLIFSGIVIGENQDEESAVLVKINPFISKSKRIIQFSGDGRYKRNGPENSALYLEFPESFFEDPKLKRLYNSLIGAGSSGSSRKSKPEKTDIVFEVDPSAFGEDKVRGKHEKRNVKDDDLAAFQLKIAPADSRMKKMGRGLQGYVPRHETTKAWCMETMPAEANTDPFMDEDTKETNKVAETMCYPSKPSTLKLRICAGRTTEDLKSARPNDPCQCYSATEEQQQIETTPYDLYTQCKSQEPVVTHYVESLCFTTERCSPKTTFMPYAVDVFSTTYRPPEKPSCLPSSTVSPSCGSPFDRFFRRRRNKDNQLRNFFVLSGSPQSCPPFCPPECTTSRPLACPSTKCTTTCPTTCSTTCPTTCSCPDITTTCPTTTTCSTPTTCSTTTAECCPKVKRARLDDPLRNVLRLLQRRRLRRVRRNPTSIRRRRRILVYKPKHGLRKVKFHSKGYLSSFE